MAGSKPSRGVMQLRLILWALVLVAGVGATLLYVVRPPERPVGLFGGAFELQSTLGGDFNQDDLVGAPSLMFFGFTFCPDVCPTTLFETTSWREDLGLSPDELRLIFASVDPERDTLEALALYLTAFDTPIIGLTGSIENVENAKKAFGVYSAKVDDPSSTEYLVDHTASVFLIGADGRFEGTISYGEDRETALAKIRKLLES